VRPCLARPNIAEDRIIRTVAGLRPYRASGFVVRAEALGDKRLVHNYGHGGAGITLSWGSSRLAVDLGLQGHQGPVAVIGAGALGLTAARLVQEAGFPVAVYAKALPPETTSDIAGGQIAPFGHYRRDAVTPAWQAQFAAAMAYSWRRFQIMVGEDYGIRWLPTYEAADGEGAGALAAYYPARTVLGRGEHPFNADRVARFSTMYVEPGRFLRQLTRDIQLAGGRFSVRDFATPADIALLPERLILNCTGLGARDLFGDGELTPIRGQLAILLPDPAIDYATTVGNGYMFPRSDGLVLGGTYERGVDKALPEPDDIARIVARHRAFFADFRCG
jgi:glycine/D-amino acid oxidase-like deaminating enzyme